MTDGAKLVLKQTIQRFTHTKTLTASDAAEALIKLGIERNSRRKGKKAIPLMPVAGPEDFKS